MNNKLVPVIKFGNKIINTVKKHSPTILMAAGIVGSIGGMGLAVKATLEVPEELGNELEELSKVKEYKDDYESPKQYQEDLIQSYKAIIFKGAKLYAPAVCTEVLAIASLMGSHKILNDRYIASLSAYSVLDRTFDAYRSRVISDVGAEKDFQYMTGAEKKKITVKDVDEETGEITESEQEVMVVPDGVNMFSLMFDESNPCWSKSRDYNKQFLVCQENAANERLKRQGVLYLSDVYEMLGVEKSMIPVETRAIGWVYDSKNQQGPDFVSFGIFECFTERTQAFCEGYERSVMLNFNCKVNPDAWLPKLNYRAIGAKHRADRIMQVR